ncbi:hypothetical protein QTP70_004459 [Hemibagrus guttatus]|uniref:Uncharacterized protein n=1 Tax=Hemibagrus guttatus TaxID=175788 RepID=A0AAE0UXD4_9TELE|nr:hypothetical protein QTP70_004459 [Hemibagrus guttatus]
MQDDGEDSFKLHSVDLELEAVARLRQLKAALESSWTDAYLSQAQCTKDVARPGFVHSGAKVPHSLDVAGVENTSQAPGEDLSPSAATRFRDLDPEPLLSPSRDGMRRTRCAEPTELWSSIRLRQTEILKKDFRSLVEKVRTTLATTRIIVQFDNAHA